MNHLILAGQLDDLGDSWIAMLKDRATKGLQAGLLVLVVIIMIQKFSLKAGIGALLLMIIALGLYNSRENLSDMFEGGASARRSGRGDLNHDGHPDLAVGAPCKSGRVQKPDAVWILNGTAKITWSRSGRTYTQTRGNLRRIARLLAG